jgi:hypothetical protein
MELASKLFSVLLMRLEDTQTTLQQRLKLSILRVRMYS